MASVAFTRNYTDHSNNNGFQFEFHCDKCGNGFRSSYQQNNLGVATQFLDAASNILGGNLWGAARAGDHLNDALRGKAWDSAFQAAITEIKPKFHQCTRCGQWVCPEVCWNAKTSLCKGCSPDMTEETVVAQSEAMRQQIAAQMQSKAQSADLVGNIDIKNQTAAVCPGCSAPIQPGTKFCGSCGKPLAPAQAFCTKCGQQIPATAKFCPGCGAPRG